LILMGALPSSAQAPSGSQKEPTTIRKSTSHYYSTGGKPIPDSSFITVTYYDQQGTRFKEEETHFVNGEKRRWMAALFKSDDQLVEMRENGKLTIKNEYDQYGTIIKGMVVLGRGTDVFEIVATPQYENGLLVKRNVVQKTKLGPMESIEHYDHKVFPDSTVVTSTNKTEAGSVEQVEKKSYNRSQKLLSISNSIRVNGRTEESWSIERRYDKDQNLTEIINKVNGRVTAAEKFMYTKGKLSSSTLVRDDVVIKTKHEYLQR
jgi:hypothetical protein